MMSCALVFKQLAQRGVSHSCKPALMCKQSSPPCFVSMAVPVPAYQLSLHTRISRCRAAHLSVRGLEAGLHALQSGKAPPAPLLHCQPLACTQCDSAWLACCVLSGLEESGPSKHCSSQVWDYRDVPGGASWRGVLVIRNLRNSTHVAMTSATSSNRPASQSQW